MKRIFEVSPDELLDEQNLEQLKEELSKRLKIRRNLREKKQQQELFDPNKPMKGYPMSNLENQAQLENYYEQFREEGHSPQEAEALARQKLEENDQ